MKKMLLYSNSGKNIRQRFSIRSCIGKAMIVVIVYFSGFQMVQAQQCMKDVTDGLAKSYFFASGDNTGEEYDRAFNNDNNAGNKWYRGSFNTSPATPNWIGVNFGALSPKTLTGYLISSANDFPGRNPRDWYFQASNDGSTWTTLDTRSNETFSYTGHSRLFTFSNNIQYSQYRLLITETAVTNESSIHIGEIEMYEKVCLEGTVTDQGTPLTGVLVAMMGETYSVAAGGGTILRTASTDANGRYEFAANEIPDGQFSLIVQPPSGYQVLSNTKPFFRDLNWGGSVQDFRIPEHYVTYDGSITFQNHQQLAQGPGETGSVNWDGEQSSTYLNRFIATSNKSQLNFDLKKAVVSQACVTLNGTPPYTNNLITVAQNGTFGSFSTGIAAGSYVRSHPGQPGFSKDYSNSLLYNNEDFVNPTSTAYTNSTKANQQNNSSWGSGVLIGESRYTVTSYIGTLADLIDGNNGLANYHSLLNAFNSGWRKTYGATTGDVYDKFLAINGAGNNLPLFIQSNLTLKGGQAYLFSFDGKHANGSSQGVTNNVEIPYILRNSSGSVVSTAGATLVLPRSTHFTEDAPDYPWEKVFTTLTPPSDGVYSLEIRYPGSGAYGNDYYIDNISLRELTDYGDNPISYGEAAHGISASGISSVCNPILFLGDRLDVENAYAPSELADTDNLDNLDDEDGVTFPILHTGMTSYTVSAKVTNTTAAGAILYGWIDWNHNGTFEASELVSAPVGAGNVGVTVTLSWNSITTTGPVYARFRLSPNDVTTGPTGFVTGGEVEDYRLGLEVRLSGAVLNDGNGNTDNTVSTNGLGALAPVNGTNLEGTQLYVTLVNSSNVPVATASVGPDGTYSFLSVAPGTYSVVLSTYPTGTISPDSPLPTGWDNTGEQLGTTSGGADNLSNGILSEIVVATTDVTDANFGINKKPVVLPGIDTPRANPGETTLSPVTSTLFQGSDQEDGTYTSPANPANNNLYGRTVNLEPGTGGDVYYNGVLVTVGDPPIPNFNPSLVTVDPAGTDTQDVLTVTFSYTVTDNAGVVSDPKIIQVPFVANPLPVKLTSFSAVKLEGFTLLNWVTTEESNSDKFEIERSADAKIWETIGSKSSSGESISLRKYDFVDQIPQVGTNYYRLKIIDKDASFAYSRIISVEFSSGQSGISIYPNPATDFVLVGDASDKSFSIEKIKSVSVINSQGIELFQSVSISSQGINLRSLPRGIYFLKIELKDGMNTTHKILVTK